MYQASQCHRVSLHASRTLNIGTGPLSLKIKEKRGMKKKGGGGELNLQMACHDMPRWDMMTPRDSSRPEPRSAFRSVDINYVNFVHISIARGAKIDYKVSKRSRPVALPRCHAGRQNSGAAASQSLPPLLGIPPDAWSQ